MKKFRTILIAFLGMAALGVNAESVLDGMIWQNDYYVDYKDSNGERQEALSSTVYLSAEGDTIVGGYTYKKIYERYFRHGASPWFNKGCLPTLYTLLREDNGKIYFIENHGDTEGKLLFDFNIEEGEIVETYDFRRLDDYMSSITYKWTGLKKTEVISEGITYPAMYVALYDDYSGNCCNESIWVDGIGLPIGCMFSWDSSYGGTTPVKTIYSAEGEIIYYTGNLSLDELYPAGVENIYASDSSDEAYGINGMKMSKDSKGIHIYRGKKVMK